MDKRVRARRLSRRRSVFKCQWRGVKADIKALKDKEKIKVDAGALKGKSFTDALNGEGEMLKGHGEAWGGGGASSTSPFNAFPSSFNALLLPFNTFPSPFTALPSPFTALPSPLTPSHRY